MGVRGGEQGNAGSTAPPQYTRAQREGIKHKHSPRQESNEVREKNLHDEA